jgi:gas vesicle protein
MGAPSTLTVRLEAPSRFDSAKESEDTVKSGIWTFVIGFIAGTASALLFAPQSGEETRDLIADRARKGIDQGSRVVRGTAARGADAVQRVKQQAEDVIETGKAAYSKAASAVE